jgi:hypothetical protein
MSRFSFEEYRIASRGGDRGDVKNPTRNEKNQKKSK